MSKISEDILLIDGLEYCNWNRELLENAHQAGLTAIHATLVYWENTEESFEKINYWHRLFKEHHDIIVHAKTTKDILDAYVSSSQRPSLLCTHNPKLAEKAEIEDERVSDRD